MPGFADVHVRTGRRTTAGGASGMARNFTDRPITLNSEDIDGETDQHAGRRRAPGVRHPGDARRAAVRERRRKHRRPRPPRRRRRGGEPRRGGRVALPQLRALGHHVARPARRAGRAETGAAPDPLHDVAAAAPGRCEAAQVRQGGGRRDGKLSPARRHRDLRHAGPDGAAVHAARAAGRRLGQLRITRRRRRGGDAVHRMPARTDQRRTAGGDRSGNGPLPAEL